MLKRRTTQKQMKYHIGLLAAKLGDSPIEKIAYNQVQKFFTNLSQTMKPKSVRNVYGTFHTILSQAAREGLINQIPKPVLPKTEDSETPWFTVGQIRSIIKNSADKELKTLFWLLGETGVRIEEALGLHVSDLDEENKAIRVVRNLKTKNARRTISLSEPLYNLLLERAKDTPEGPLFNRSENHYRNLLGRTIKESNIKTEAVAPFHAFRRGNATIMDTIGVPLGIAKKRFGHKGEGLFLGVYVQSEKYADRTWAQKIGDLLA